MAKHRAASELDASQIVFTTPGLSDTEIAAVTAVLTAAVHEQAAGDEPQSDESVQSAWQQSQRALRAPLHRGVGAWRSFG
ncbi:hypothetical protein GCM10027568_01290 [Humibacter soli]